MNKKQKKLGLKSTTLRHLNPGTLAAIRGAGYTTTNTLGTNGSANCGTGTCTTIAMANCEPETVHCTMTCTCTQTFD